MLDLGQGRGSYDAAVVAAFFYGDLIAGNHMAPVDPLLASGKFPRWSYNSMPPALRQLYSWDNVGYGVLNDADGQVLYYRRDVLNDPANQTAFKAALGYDLPVPPQTWQQVLDIARFFAGKNWDHHDSQPDSGMVLHLKPGEQGFYHFQSLSASFAVAPGPEMDRYHNVYWFDPQDMKPLINEAGDVAALELLQQLGATGPADQIGWRLPQAWEYFLRGKAVMMFTWGDLGALCQDPSTLTGQWELRRRDAARAPAATGIASRPSGSSRPSPIASATPPAARGTASCSRARRTRTPPIPSWR